MTSKMRSVFLLSIFGVSGLLSGAQDAQAPLVVDAATARQHEQPPQRGTVPVEGVAGIGRRLHLKLQVSAEGRVAQATAKGHSEDLAHWPELQAQVMQWRYLPFERDGRASLAEVSAYLELVPPEKLPAVHVPPPELRADSEILIELVRTGCMGTCPAYTV